MMQICKKKKQHRQSIRREFLDNYFSQMRRKCFNFTNNQHKNQPTTEQQRVLEFLLGQSLKFNCLALRMRQFGLADQLQNLVGQALKEGSLLEVRFLLTIISNGLKDQLNVDQKATLFKLSIKLFSSLNLSHFDLKNRSQHEKFKKILQILHVQTLIYYMSAANETSQFLDEQDQIQIEQLIYPAFSNLLLHTLSHPEQISNIDKFQSDIYLFFKAFYDQDDAFYQESNRMKAQRLLPFYQDIFKGHIYKLRNSDPFGQHFSWTEPILFKSYLKLIEVIGQAPEFLKGKQILVMMEFTLIKGSNQKIQPQLNFVYSILHIFLEKKIIIENVERLLLMKDLKTGIICFERAINLVMQNSKIRFSALQMIQDVVTCRFEDSLFRELIETYEILLMDMCALTLGRFEEEIIGQFKQRKLVLRVLNIVRLLAEKEIIEGKKVQTISLVRHFINKIKPKTLESIAAWFHEVDVGEDMEIAECLDDIQQILQIIDLDIEIEVQ